MANPHGRKPKLTKDVITTICQVKRVGLPNSHIAGYCSISQQTLWNWLRKGEDDHLRNRKSLYSELFEGVQKAESDRMAEALLKVRDAANGGAVLDKVTVTKRTKEGIEQTTVREKKTAPQWQAAAWFLERQHPSEFAQRTKTEISGPDGSPIQVNTLSELMELADEAEKEEIAKNKQNNKKP